MSDSQQPKVEEITDEYDGAEHVDEGSNVVVHNRNEKKARKLIGKLNLKKVEGISRVFFRTGRNSMFTINEPDVYKNPSTGTYVVFGEAKMDNHQANLANLQNMLAQSGAAGQAGEQAAQAPKDPNSIQADMEAAAAANASTKASLDDDNDNDADVDMTGVDEESFKIVKSQLQGVSDKKIADKLREQKNDVVNSIMELST